MSDSQPRPWVFLQGQQIAFQFDPQQHNTLLDALEANQVSVHAECRSGYCGACRTRAITGDVNYPQAPLAFIRSGEILPCCCQPISDLTIDDQ